MPTIEGDWTYADPALDDVSAVRYYVGDTDTEDRLIGDEAVDYALTNNADDPLRASIEICGVLAARFARESSYRIGQVSETFKQKSEAYERRVRSLTDLLNRRGGSGPYAGGISVTDKETQEADTDRPTSVFTVGMHDN